MHHRRNACRTGQYNPIPAVGELVFEQCSVFDFLCLDAGTFNYVRTQCTQFFGQCSDALLGTSHRDGFAMQRQRRKPVQCRMKLANTADDDQRGTFKTCCANRIIQCGDRGNDLFLIAACAVRNDCCGHIRRHSSREQTLHDFGQSAQSHQENQCTAGLYQMHQSEC